jgi:hypothetical protein
VDAGSSVGFDNHTPRRGGTAAALATLQVGQKYGLYRADILAGKAKTVGTFPSRHRIVDLAIQVDQRVGSAAAPAGS